MQFRKIIIFLTLLVSYHHIFAQEYSYTESTIYFDANYYGLPLAGKFGYQFRKNNFSLSPYLGLIFDVNETYSMDAMLGLDFIYKNIFLESKVYYELLPALTQDNFNFVTIQVMPGYASGSYSIKLPISYGYKKFDRTEDSTFNDDFVSGKIVFDAFLVDNGLVRMTSFLETGLTSIYNKQFNYYTINLSIPCTFYLSIFDFGIIYNFASSHELSFQSLTPIEKARISFPYSSVTKRLPFVKEDKNNMLIHSLEFEQRWYPFRKSNITSNFFVSLFENIGLGLSTEKDLNLFYQLGVGIGYNLYDSVPFTMQVGFNQDNNLLLFVGVVSNIHHKP